MVDPFLDMALQVGGLIAYGIFVLLSAGAGKWIQNKLRERRTILPNAPILMSEALAGGGDVVASTAFLTPHGLHISLFVTTNTLFSALQTRGVYAVELPFVSAAHLIGIPAANDTPINLQRAKGIEPVELEGTYNQIFHLYAQPNQQVDSRYVLDPSAMAFTMDFCQQFNWEIVGDTLYFMDSGHLPPLTIIDTFIEQIRPALEIPSERYKNPHTLPYANLQARTFLCPVCGIKLMAGDAWLECPNHHGYLVTGKQLLAMRQPDSATPQPVADNTPHGTLRCPYCNNPMKPTKYQHTDIELDVCTKCMFRWMDATEPAILFNSKVAPSRINRDI